MTDIGIIREIRTDFPILSSRVYSRPLVYLDSAATAQKPTRVTDRISVMHRTMNANVHRGVHYMSEQCTELYEQARSRVASFIGAQADEVVFTSGATMSLNLLAHSLGNMVLGAGDSIVVTRMEHHSNIVPWQMAAERHAARIKVWEIDREGSLVDGMLDSLLDSGTRILCVTQASNVLGTMPDIPAICRKAHERGVLVVVDGCQGVVHATSDMADLGCDFYAFSAHKLYGPTGVGVLWGRKELLDRMPPFLGGGDMIEHVSFEGTTYGRVPLKFEAGTPDYIGAVGLGEAVEYLREHDMASLAAYELELTRYAADRLSAVPGLTVYGQAEHRGPILSFNVDGVHNYDMGMILDKLGVAVRTGAHCADPVMDFYGVPGMCRASFAFYNLPEEADALAAGVDRAVRMLRRRD